MYLPLACDVLRNGHVTNIDALLGLHQTFLENGHDAQSALLVTY